MLQRAHEVSFIMSTNDYTTIVESLRREGWFATDIEALALDPPVGIDAADVGHVDVHAAVRGLSSPGAATLVSSHALPDLTHSLGLRVEAFDTQPDSYAPTLMLQSLRQDVLVPHGLPTDSWLAPDESLVYVDLLAVRMAGVRAFVVGVGEEVALCWFDEASRWNVKPFGRPAASDATVLALESVPAPPRLPIDALRPRLDPTVHSRVSELDERGTFDARWLAAGLALRYDIATTSPGTRMPTPSPVVAWARELTRDQWDAAALSLSTWTGRWLDRTLALEADLSEANASESDPFGDELWLKAVAAECEHRELLAGLSGLLTFAPPSRAVDVAQTTLTTATQRMVPFWYALPGDVRFETPALRLAAQRDGAQPWLSLLP